jgi:hypothetical protein
MVRLCGPDADHSPLGYTAIGLLAIPPANGGNVFRSSWIMEYQSRFHPCPIPLPVSQSQISFCFQAPTRLGSSRNKMLPQFHYHVSTLASATDHLLWEHLDDDKTAESVPWTDPWLSNSTATFCRPIWPVIWENMSIVHDQDTGEGKLPNDLIKTVHDPSDPIRRTQCVIEPRKPFCLTLPSQPEEMVRWSISSHNSTWIDVDRAEL